MDIFDAAHGWGRAKKALLPKISHTYPIMTKLGTVIPYLKVIQKITIFFTGNQQLLLYQEIKI